MSHAGRSSPRSISVLMPTYQAAEFLERVLAALATQQVDVPWDFTALDCGSTDATLAIFERFAARFPVPLNVIAQDDVAFDHGDARNVLAASTRGELLVYLTDDAIPSSADWLATLHACFADPRVGAAYCRNQPRPEARPFARIATREDPTYSHEGRVQELPSRRRMLDLGSEDLRALYAFCDTASAVRRALWERHPYPITQAGEDVLLARALIDAGYVVRYEPDACVLHSHEWSETRLRRRAEVDGRFNRAVFGRVAVRDDDDARARVADALERDRRALVELGSSGAELERELAFARSQRAAHFHGLLEGQRTMARRLPSALLESPRLSIGLIALRDADPRADALLRALVERGHACERVGALAPDAARELDLLHAIDPLDVDPLLGSRPELAHVPAIVPERGGWTMLAFGLAGRALARHAISESRLEAHPRPTGELDAARWEARYRALAAIGASSVVIDRWARECDVREGAVREQGSESLLLGRMPAAIGFDVGPLPPDEWTVEIHVELLGAEPALAMHATVRVDDRVVGSFAGLASDGGDRIEALRFELPPGSRPRHLRIESGRAFDRKGFARIRRVLLTRRPRNRREPARSAPRRSLERLRVYPGAPLADASLPRIAVIVPTLDGGERLSRCLAALEACDYPPARVATTVVDNGSRAATRRRVERRHAAARVIAMTRNVGFTRAIAAGVDANADADVLVFVNDDVVVDRAFLRELVSPIARGECAATGARMLLADGKPEYQGGGASFQGFALGYAPWELDLERGGDPRRALFACGGAMAIGASAWRDVGGFDPEFFAYYDDLDLGWRLWLFGHEVHYAPSAICRHERSSTSRRFPAAAIRRLQVRNALLCCIKNYGDASLDRALPALLALAVRRAWVMARRAHAPELAIEGRTPRPWWSRWLLRSRIPLDALAVADVAAINEVLGAWDHWMERRASIQARRRRDDREIFELLVHPTWCVEGEREYVELQAALARRFALGELFGEASPARDERVLAPARGCFESIECEDESRGGRIAIEGWMVALDGPIDRVEASVDGRPIAFAATHERADVARAFPGASGASRSGFRAVGELAPAPRDAWRTVRAVGVRAGVEVASMRCLWRADYRRLFDDPPVEAMLRVAAAPAPIAFRLDGLRTLAEFLDALAPHRRASSIQRVLDWGSGCGRVSGFLSDVVPSWRVFGCDVDASAIAWCRSSHRGEYEACAPMPPTRYEDGAFDLILGYSVLTHLDRERQAAWIAELARLLADDGILLATVQGPQAAAMLGLEAVLARLESDGVDDAIVDRALAGVVPDGEYRSVFQTEAWTRERFAVAFEVLDYLPRGAQGLQDLIVARKRPARARRSPSSGRD